MRVRVELARQDMEVADEEKTPSPRMLRESARCRRRQVETYSIEQDVGHAERQDLATKNFEFGPSSAQEEVDVVRMSS